MSWFRITLNSSELFGFRPFKFCKERGVREWCSAVENLHVYKPEEGEQPVFCEDPWTQNSKK
jgi:hypothetical protein